MAFRRDSDRSLRWQQWLSQHRNALVAIGLPDWIFTDERRWICFLQEGGIDWESRWKIEMLSPQQAKLFFDFMVSDYGSQEHKTCLLALEQRAAILFDGERPNGRATQNA